MNLGSKLDWIECAKYCAWCGIEHVGQILTTMDGSGWRQSMKIDYTNCQKMHRYRQNFLATCVGFFFFFFFLFFILFFILYDRNSNLNLHTCIFWRSRGSNPHSHRGLRRFWRGGLPLDWIFKWRFYLLNNIKQYIFWGA